MHGRLRSLRILLTAACPKQEAYAAGSGELVVKDKVKDAAEYGAGPWSLGRAMEGKVGVATRAQQQNGQKRCRW